MNAISSVSESQNVNDIFQKVKELLRLEATAIECAAERLDNENVSRAIELIANAKGKVVVVGVGKSGVIAQKIAQTLASTGTVAVFLHASDALHGGLGVLTTDDVVVAISNSGETDEILAIVPTFKARGVPLISIVGNLSSTLANLSDAVLDASVDKEACPLDLAPTASTTVALAIGDAIAMALMESQELSASDFAANHPAGRLGKRLTVTVGHLMHESPNIKGDATWLEVIGAISKHALGAVNVVDAEGSLIGIITDGDLRRTIENTEPIRLAELRAASMMTSRPVTVRSTTLAYDALRLMEDRPSQISVLPVVDDHQKCIGLLRIHDIVRSGI